MGICRFAPDVTSKERVEDVYLRFAKVYKAFSSEVHASRLVFSGWGVKSLSTYPMTVRRYQISQGKRQIWASTTQERKSEQKPEAKARKSPNLQSTLVDLSTKVNTKSQARITRGRFEGERQRNEGFYFLEHSEEVAQAVTSRNECQLDPTDEI
ncbi:hypothetical protein Tco_0185872 [Tanacetum coccineum]